MSLVLRPARPEDAEAIAALFSRSFRLLDFLPELHSVAEDLGFIRDHVLPAQRVTVAEREGRIVGFAAEAAGWLHHLYVDSGLLGSGIGSALLAETQSRNASLELWCFAENHRARGFYEGHGFLAVAATDGSGNEFRAPDIRYRWQR